MSTEPLTLLALIPLRKEGGMVHACTIVCGAGWVSDLPTIAAKAGPPNAEVVLHKRSPLKNCFHQVVQSFTSEDADDLPSASVAV